MRLQVTTGRIVGAVLITGLTACGGSSSGTSPTSPSGGGGGGGGSTGPACRTYYTNENITTRTSGTSIVFNAIQSATFDTSTKKATTTVKFANGSVCGSGARLYADGDRRAVRRDLRFPLRAGDDVGARPRA